MTPVVSERARDTAGDQIKLVQHRTRADWNSVLNRNGAASMALSDPAITKWLSPRWPADLPSLHRNPIICYLRTEWIRNRYAEKFIESITGTSSSSAERSDESATRKVLLICDLQLSPVTFYAGFYSRDFVRRCYAPSKLSEARLARYKLDGSSWGISGPFTPLLSLLARFTTRQSQTRLPRWIALLQESALLARHCI